MHLAGIGGDVLITHAQLGGPGTVQLTFPLGKQRSAVTLAIIDVLEGIGRHAASAGGRPVIIQAIALILATHAQQIIGAQLNFRLDATTQRLAVAVHRHTRRGTVLELLVRAEVHLVLDLLVVDLSFQAAPVEFAEITQVQALLRVVGHVHALIGEQLLRNLLLAKREFEQILAQFERHAQFVIAGFIGRGGHLIQRRSLTRTPRRRRGFEIITGHVVIGLAGAAGVADVEHIIGMHQRHMTTARIVVAAHIGTDFTLVQALRTRLSKFRFQTLSHDAAANTVSAHADRSNTGIYLERTKIARIHVGQRRVHVIGAGRNQVHAIDLDPQTIIGQTADRGQAGKAAGRVQAHTGNPAQEGGTVIGQRGRTGRGPQIDIGRCRRSGCGFGGNHRRSEHQRFASSRVFLDGLFGGQQRAAQQQAEQCGVSRLPAQGGFRQGKGQAGRSSNSGHDGIPHGQHRSARSRRPRALRSDGDRLWWCA